MASTNSSQRRESQSKEEFMVERIHRLKPKWPAKLGLLQKNAERFLVLHDDFFELVPGNAERPKIFSKPISKHYAYVGYDWLGAVDIVKHPSAHGSFPLYFMALLLLKVGVYWKLYG